MDFVISLLKTRRQHKSIWVILYMITKSAHFILVKSTYKADNYLKLYIVNIVRWHGSLLSINSYRGAQFHSHFQISFQNNLVMQVKLTTAFQPQTDGKAERTIQRLEDMFMDCVIYFKVSWYGHLPLIEFLYSNSYHSSIGM